MKRQILTIIQLFLVCFAVFLILPVSATSLPVAGFVSDVKSGTVPLSVRFTDLSTNSPTEWIWSFGDGDTSSEQNPSHTYTQAGTYTVTLAATNPGGSDTVTMTEYVTVNKPIIAPVAFFVSNVTSGTGPLAVQFLDSSTNSPTSMSWDFGDGSTSSGPSPSHVYSSIGVYSVTLTATNAAGTGTVTRTGYITVGAPVTDIPVARFVSTVNSGTAPQTVQFIDASTNFPNAWFWSFGDGDTSTAQNPLHTYIRPGIYRVTLTAANALGNHTIVKDNYIAVESAIPVASFVATSITGTAPFSVQFTDTSTHSPTSWDWQFGDGNVSAMQNPVYVYTVPGVYTVSLSAMNAAGRGTLTRSAYITVSAVSPPVASFTSDVHEGTTPLTIRFSDTSINSPVSWAWSFGDGTVASVKNPSHTYMTSGSYDVTLMVTNAGGSHASTMRDYITASGSDGTVVVTPLRESPASDESPVHYAEVTVTAAVDHPPATNSHPAPVVSVGAPSGVSLLILIIALLLVVGLIAIWWMTRSPKRSGRQRGGDL